MKRMIIAILIIIFLCSCSKNEISVSDLPITYEPYDDNSVERIIWKLQGIDTILYGGAIQIIDSNSYFFDGCYCQISGEWEQRNDSLFLHHQVFSYDTTKPKLDFDCSKLENTTYLIKKNGAFLELVNNRDNVLLLYSATVKDK